MEQSGLPTGPAQAEHLIRQMYAEHPQDHARRELDLLASLKLQLPHGGAVHLKPPPQREQAQPTAP